MRTTYDIGLVLFAVIAALRDRGCHQTDIGDAFYEADPELRVRP